MLKTIIKFLIKLYCTITFWVMWPVLWNKSIIFEPKRVDGIPLKSEYNKAIKNNIILSAFGWVFLILITFSFLAAFFKESKKDEFQIQYYPIFITIYFLIPLIISSLYLKSKVKKKIR